MSANWSLRNRLAVTLALFGGLVSLSLASIIYIASHDLESRLIDDTLTAELDDYVARRQRNPQSLPERTATIRAYVVTADGGASQVPDAVRSLQPGRHTLLLDGISYLAAVRKVDEQHFVVLYDTSALNQREEGFLFLLLISVVLVTLVSALAGRWLAARLIAPVDELARRVSELHPEDEPRPLANEFPWIEVRRLAQDFDVYIQRLHDFIEREKLFTGDVSHELRTPLAVIHGATELMLADEKLDARNHQRVMRITRAANEMVEITAALLALSREQSRQQNRQQTSAAGLSSTGLSKAGPSTTGPSSQCDAETVACEVIERYQEIFKHKSITVLLDVQQPLMVSVDHAILSMVLGNLLRNALSFTDQGEVIVRIDTNSIQVEDNGPGLGTQQPEELFKPYVRGSQSSGAAAGAGLGLSLVWRLCELNGWRIELKNRSEGGTLAQLWLT